ncbi:MAG: mechanosensitive ion channel domain-containing protein [Cyanobacteria bacterium P01_H01_bin.121]
MRSFLEDVTELLKELGMGTLMTKTVLIELAVRLGTLMFVALLCSILGWFTSGLVRWLIRRSFIPRRATSINEKLIDPLCSWFRFVGTFAIIALVGITRLLEPYPVLLRVANFLVSFSLIASVAWLLSRLFHQFIHAYGLELIQRWGRGINELFLVFETIVNVVIGFFALLACARHYSIDIGAIVAGFGIGTLAVSLAARETLEQLIGTFVLYLDNPFQPGDYLRVYVDKEFVFGRAESIGLRSTKLRAVGKGTLMIVPNSQLVKSGIENITRGKKIMVLLYLEFPKILTKNEQALVQQVVSRCSDTIYGIDPGSTDIRLHPDYEQRSTRARVTFFILGSNESSVDLRKRLLELANEKISQELLAQGLRFKIASEPTIYVDSPVIV